MSQPHLVSVLKRGGLAFIPTDTIYGIVARARDRKAAMRLYTLRRRTPEKPFIILIDSVARLRDFGVAISSSQRAFLKKVWPGKVSVILPCTAKKFSYLHLGTEALAFRVPKSKGLQALLKKTGPLVAPSANREGGKPAETVAEAKRYFGSHVALYVHGRTTRTPSTLISLLSWTPRVIRAGAGRVGN